MWGYVGVTYSIAGVQFPGDCGPATSATETTCFLSQSGNELIYSLGFNDLNPITAFVVLIGFSIVFFFLSWLVLARPWDKGPIRLVVAAGSGEEGLEALESIAEIEQVQFKSAVANFNNRNDMHMDKDTASATPHEDLDQEDN
jgi:hypothetical protein